MENIETIKESEFLDFYNSRTYNANWFNDDGSLNKNYNSFKSTGIIASIFEDHWDKTYSDNKELIDKYRPNATIEVQKIIDCYNKNLGCSLYECPHCHDIVFIGHTCKSRFCSSCGYKYKNDRVENILQTVYNCNHRQIVFTIPEQLRIYFFFAFLHTFGRNLKWNPHIHILIAEIKLGDNGSFVSWTYFDYDALSLRFQKILLDLLSKDLGKSFDKDKNLLYRKYSKGFYVYAEPKKFPDFKSGVEYVTRYCGRVPISENRIINYDGSNVTFSYIDHKDNKYHEVTLKRFCIYYDSFKTFTTYSI